MKNNNLPFILALILFVIVCYFCIKKPTDSELDKCYQENIKLRDENNNLKYKNNELKWELSQVDQMICSEVEK